MWRPGFAYSHRRKARLNGWRRRLCIYSHVYRGTPERPGLVLGLDRGGSCPGVAFLVDAALRESTIRYLREREQATAVYIERFAPVVLDTGERVLALTYVADAQSSAICRTASAIRHAGDRARRGGQVGRQRRLRHRDLRPSADDWRARPRSRMVDPAIARASLMRPGALAARGQPRTATFDGRGRRR